MTTINKHQNALSQVNICSKKLFSTGEKKEITFNNIDDESLISQLVFAKCNMLILSTINRIVKHIVCNSRRLVFLCQPDLSLKLTHS